MPRKTTPKKKVKKTTPKKTIPKKKVKKGGGLMQDIIKKIKKESNNKGRNYNNNLLIPASQT